jgi:hypothetical protein
MTPSSQLHFAWHDAPGLLRRFQTGVSLHSHTMHSQESLDFLPPIARKVPLVRQAVDHEERQYEKRHGRARRMTRLTGRRLRPSARPFSWSANRSPGPWD